MGLTRRELLHLSAGIGGALAFGWRPARGQEEAALRTRPIPSTGEAIPVVGIGTARRYDVGDDAEARAVLRDVLRRFTELGGRVIDTAPTYGTAEAVSGDLIRELGTRDEFFIATKVSLREGGREAGIQQMEESFRRFGTGMIDLMQVHNLRDVDTQLRTLREWKAAGRIRYLGITTSFPRQYDEFEQVMRRERLDFVQMDYSIINRDVEERLLPLAADRGMAVLINLPYGRGRTFQAVGDRPLPEWAAEIDCTSWGQFFLKWILGHPAVTCVIPGTATTRYLIDNLGAARGRLPDTAMRRRMAEVVASG